MTTGSVALSRDRVATDLALSRELTPMQAAFVDHYVNTPGAIGNASEAARLAGYSPATARVQGQQQLAKPHVAAAFRLAVGRRLAGPMVAKSAAFLESVVDDPNAPLGIRVKCAQDILDRNAVRAAPGMSLDAGPQADPRKALGQSVAEMLQAIATLRPDSRPTGTIIEGESEAETDG